MKLNLLGYVGTALIAISLASFAALAYLMPVGFPSAESPLYIRIFDYSFTYWMRETLIPPPLIILGAAVCAGHMWSCRLYGQQTPLSTRVAFYFGMAIITVYVLLQVIASGTHVN